MIATSVAKIPALGVAGCCHGVSARRSGAYVSIRLINRKPYRLFSLVSLNQLRMVCSFKA